MSLLWHRHHGAATSQLLEPATSTQRYALLCQFLRLIRCSGVVCRLVTWLSRANSWPQVIEFGGSQIRVSPRNHLAPPGKYDWSVWWRVLWPVAVITAATHWTSFWVREQQADSHVANWEMLRDRLESDGIIYSTTAKQVQMKIIKMAAKHTNNLLHYSTSVCHRHKYAKTSSYSSIADFKCTECFYSLFIKL